MLNHPVLDLFDNGVDTECCPLEHRYRMVIVDQVGLRTRLTHGHASILKLLTFLLLMDFLLLLLRYDSLLYVELAQADQIIDEILADLYCLFRMQECLFMSMEL